MIDPGGEAPMTRVLLFAMAFLFAAQGAEAQSSRFYLRGDLGLVLGTPAVETDTDPGSAIASLGPTTINGNYGTGMMFDAGVGFRAFPFLRLEGTIGYLPSLSFKGNFGNVPAATTQGSVSALVGLASADVDITAFTGRLPGGLQPFVMGGLGFATVTSRQEDDFFNGIYNGSISGATQTNLAWTVGGGVGIAVMDRLTLDVTYRWLDLGERKVGSTLLFNSATAPTTPDRADLRVHTIMVGLRYQL
jgi:opacity protein-like surface antigen